MIFQILSSDLHPAPLPQWQVKAVVEVEGGPGETSQPRLQQGASWTVSPPKTLVACELGLLLSPVKQPSQNRRSESRERKEEEKRKREPLLEAITTGRATSPDKGVAAVQMPLLRLVG